MKLREIYRSPNYYSICECDRIDSHVIYVIAGGALMYEVVVKLTPDNFHEFEASGHLDKLAYQIAQGHSDFVLRQLKPDTPVERIEFVTNF